MIYEVFCDRIKAMASEWYLRMESSSFLILVHKETNKYANVYEYEFSKGMLPILANSMEKHPSIKNRAQYEI